MNAADYYEWWKYSGTGLGSACPSQRYRQLRQELSEAGTNVVIVSDLLAINQDVVDLNRWRRESNMYGDIDSIVRIVAQALESIGASGTAKEVLVATSIPVVESDLPNDEDAKREILASLRAQLRSPGGGDLLRPRQTPGAETPREVMQLLDAYVHEHEEQLCSDRRRYGDPREEGGFDAERFLAEQERKNRQLRGFREQDRELPRFRAALVRLSEQLRDERSDAARLKGARADVFRHYRRFASTDSENLLPGLQSLMREARDLLEEYIRRFEIAPTKDDCVNARLAAIGPYAVDSSTSISWRSLPALSCGWTTLALAFSASEIDPEPEDLARVYESLLAEWDRFTRRFAALEPQLKEHVLARLRPAVDLLPDADREEFEEEYGSVSDETLLRSLRNGCVTFLGDLQGTVDISVSFATPFDEEHGIHADLGNSRGIWLVE